MDSFFTFIRYYIIISASFLIPFSDFSQEEVVDISRYSQNISESGSLLEDRINRNKSVKILKYDAIDADGNNQLFLDSDFLLETTPNFEELAVAFDIDLEVTNQEQHNFTFSSKIDNDEFANNTKTPDFWTTLHSIESKQGRLLYRPSNKNKNCSSTSSPCGHHQLSLQALKDISCTTRKCKSDREDYKKSLAMSKRFEAINLKRLKQAGFTNLPEYQQYLIHQQGAAGLKIILSASHGKKTLSRKLEKNMANNSPYSYKKLRKLGSKLAAKKFLHHWKQKWQDEKKLIVAYQSKSKQSTKLPTSKIKDKAVDLPFFNDYQLQIALNLKPF